MEFSGERYLPEITGFQISYEHWHRYLYATGFSKGKTVLDIASGEGYGADLLAENAAAVVGVDINDETVQHARLKYRKDNLTFLTGTVSSIPIEGTAQFDLIVSFETIEHINQTEQAAFLQEVKRLLRPGGIFIVSTPNKLLYSDQPEYHNAFHKKEFYVHEFEAFLNGYFEHVEILGQDIYTASYIHPPSESGNFLQYNLAFDKGFYPKKVTNTQDTYQLAICSAESLPGLPFSLLFNSGNKLADYELGYQVLYVDTGNGFNEAETLLFGINSLKNESKVHFDLSGFSNIINLRYDPAACPVYIKINKVSIETNEGAVINTGFSTNALLQKSPFFLFDSDDPQVLLNLPKTGKLKTATFEVEYLGIGAEVFPYMQHFSGEDQGQVARLESVNENQGREVARLELAVGNQEREVIRLEHALKEKEQHIERLTQALQTNGALFKSVQEQLGLLQKQTGLLEKGILEKNLSIDDLSHRLSEAMVLAEKWENLHQQAKTDLAKATEAIRQLESALSAKESKLQLTDASLKEKTTQLSELTLRLSASNNLAKTHEEKILLLTNSLATALETFKTIEASLKTKDEALVSKDVQIEKLRQKIEDHLHESAILQKEISHKNEIIAGQSGTILSLEDRLSRVVKETKTQSEQLNVAQEKLNEYAKQNEQLIASVQKLEASLQEKEELLDILTRGNRRKAHQLQGPKPNTGQATPATDPTFWSRFAQIAWHYPGSFIKNINSKNISTLRKAIKNEPPSLILNNFVKLLSGTATRMKVVPVEATNQAENQSEEIASVAPATAPNDRKVHYFIDQMEELDFHFSIRGWLFAESHDIQQLALVISDGSRVTRSALLYHIDRPDVYNYYGKKQALKSGFNDSVEKPFTGKALVSFAITYTDGLQSVIDIGETELRAPFVTAYARDIQTNRQAFPSLTKKHKKQKRSVALYTNSGGNYFFNEIKALVGKGFQTLGYETLMLNEQDGFENDALLHIVVAPHEFFEIGEGTKYATKPSNRLILLNTEQPSSAWFRKGTAYFANAIEIWDMNYYSWQRLHQTIGFASFIPLGFVKNFDLLGEVKQLPNNYFTCFLDKKIREQSFLHKRFEERPIDILFVGHASPRRQQFFAKYAAFFARFNCYFHLTDLSLGPVKDSASNMNTPTAVGLAQRAKIVLNIHHGSQQYFEWHRIVMHGIWHKALVLSDPCDECPPFVAGRDFIQLPLDGLIDKMAYFLETSAGKSEANKIISSAYRVLTTQCDLAVELEKLTSALMQEKNDVVEMLTR